MIAFGKKCWNITCKLCSLQVYSRTYIKFKNMKGLLEFCLNTLLSCFSALISCFSNRECHVSLPFHSRAAPKLPTGKSRGKQQPQKTLMVAFQILSKAQWEGRTHRAERSNFMFSISLRCWLRDHPRIQY